MTVIFADAFASRTPDAFWNAGRSGATWTGTGVQLAAGGSYFGAAGKDRVSLRELVWQFAAGDRPGFKLFNPSGQLVSATAVPAANQVIIEGLATWSYTGSHSWWKAAYDGTGVRLSTSPDGSTWTLLGDGRGGTVIPVAGGDAAGISEWYFNSAGGGIGVGTSTVAAVVDNFTWQDTPLSFTLTTPTRDDGQRANENPLSNGGYWDSPGFIDGHGPLQLVSREIVNTGTLDGGLSVPVYNGAAGQEAWAVLAASTPVGGEPTVFACMQANPKNGYDCWTTWDGSASEYYVGRFDAGGFTGLQPNLPTPGGRLLAGDGLALVVAGGVVTPAIYRAATRTWTAISRIADATYSTGRIGLGAIAGTTYSAFGGGDVVVPTSPALVSPGRASRGLVMR